MQTVNNLAISPIHVFDHSKTLVCTIRYGLNTLRWRGPNIGSGLLRVGDVLDCKLGRGIVFSIEPLKGYIRWFDGTDVFQLEWLDFIPFTK